MFIIHDFMRASSDFFRLLNVLYSSNDYKFHKDLREIRILSLGSKLAEIPDLFFSSNCKVQKIVRLTDAMVSVCDGNSPA